MRLPTSIAAENRKVHEGCAWHVKRSFKHHDMPPTPLLPLLSFLFPPPPLYVDQNFARGEILLALSSTLAHTRTHTHTHTLQSDEHRAPAKAARTYAVAQCIGILAGECGQRQILGDLPPGAAGRAPAVACMSLWPRGNVCVCDVVSVCL